MRRSDREIKDFDKMINILSSCDCIRLGLVDEGMAYIVPLNFGFTIDKDKKDLRIYIHSAKEGKKIQLLKSQNKVSFEADTNHKISQGKTACQYSYFYQSVMGKASVEFLQDESSKISALNSILSHYTNKDDWDFDKNALSKTDLICLHVLEWSCKEHV